MPWCLTSESTKRESCAASELQQHAAWCREPEFVHAHWPLTQRKILWLSGGVCSLFQRIWASRQHVPERQDPARNHCSCPAGSPVPQAISWVNNTRHARSCENHMLTGWERDNAIPIGKGGRKWSTSTWTTCATANIFCNRKALWVSRCTQVPWAVGGKHWQVKQPSQTLIQPGPVRKSACRSTVNQYWYLHDSTCIYQSTSN